MDLKTISPVPEQPDTMRVRIVTAAAFFGLALWLGSIASQILLQRYTSYTFGSFGFNFKLGLFTIGEPGSSWFVLLSCGMFVWAGCSLVRRGGGFRIGAIVGAIAFSLLAMCLLTMLWP